MVAGQALAGFDNFEWDVEVRHWLGGRTLHLTVPAAGQAITEVLDRYEARDEPPFAG
jgi:hypothetical protein